MKKFVLIVACLGVGVAGFAQKSLIRSAKNYLGEKNFDKAKAAIEEAVTSDDTKDDPYAWYTRALVYMAMQQEQANADKDYFGEAGKSLKKVVQLKSDYEKEEVNNRLFAIAIYNFNAGITSYNVQNPEGYDKAYKNFAEVADIHDLENGKRFSGKNWAPFDTIAKQAALYQGYSAYYNNKFDEAAPILEKLKNDPIVGASSIYQMLADIYEAKNDEATLLATIAEGKKLYPNDKVLVNRELNYYLKQNKTDQLTTKLEEAIKTDPSNPDLFFALGVAYDNMANPKDKDQKELPKPANYEELFAKAEQAYLNTLKVGNKPDYSFNTAVLYYNRAAMVNDQMNAITGSSAADLKKLEELKAKRDEWFGKALPYFESVVSMLEANSSSLQGEDKNTYINALAVAKEIYVRQNNLDKATEYKKKLEAVNN